MTVQAYEKLSKSIQEKIESSYQQPSTKSLIVKMFLSLLMPAAAPLMLHTSLGKTRVVDLTRLGNKTKAMALIVVAKLALISLIYHVMKFSNQENRGRMEAIRSLISGKLKNDQYVAIKLDNTIYCIDSKGVTSQDHFVTEGKKCVMVDKLLKEHDE